jgi:hypothetical protein
LSGDIDKKVLGLVEFGGVEELKMRSCGRVPSHITIKKYAKALGLWADFVRLREHYKLKGLMAREAAERSWREMRIVELWQDWRGRKTQQEIMGSGVPITPEEMKEIHPSYQVPSITNGAEVGEEVLSLAEQVRWANEELAMVRNGGDQPHYFPSKGTMSWYQFGLSNETEFRKMVVRTEAPGKGPEDAMLRDGEYQFEEIERQLREAVKEVGSQWREIETSIARAFDRELLVPV